MTVNTLLPLWKRFCSNRIGRWLFSYLVRFVNPYSGRLGAQISVLERGYAEVLLDDKKRNRNHLNSIHAIALTNLGEFTSGLVVLSSIKTDTRGIVTHISVDFLKKARGRLRSVCRCVLPDINKDMELKVSTDIFDQEDALVCAVHVTWQLGPVR